MRQAVLKGILATYPASYALVFCSQGMPTGEAPRLFWCGMPFWGENTSSTIASTFVCPCGLGPALPVFWSRFPVGNCLLAACLPACCSVIACLHFSVIICCHLRILIYMPTCVVYHGLGFTMSPSGFSRCRWTLTTVPTYFCHVRSLPLRCR